jgi:long-chain acyl-CoA synthetase
MYIGDFARSNPDRPAAIMAFSGEIVTYAQLYAGANRLARLLHAAGLREGDHYAVFAENTPLYYEAVWAGLNNGMYVTAINNKLTTEEVAYIINDSHSQVLITTAALTDVAERIVADTPGVVRRLMMGGSSPSYENYEAAVAAYSDEPCEGNRGMFMLYSSGTTGKPKGVKFPLPGHQATEGDMAMLPSMTAMFAMVESDVYLSPAPLYHAAPLRTSATAQCLGVTIIVLEHFDPVVALECIERYGVTKSQWVPTMFVRMLKLDPAERARFDLSSHQIAVHAAAPCPVEVKDQMISWWGPIIFEYYAGTENIGTTALGSEEWLAHKGSVGRALNAVLHICDDDGVEVPVGDVGTVYFENDNVMEYHNDRDKTASARHAVHTRWRTLGDVGYVDADNYLYLTDRKAFMIVSGGVNIYPQEIEAVMIMHPKVLDVAVFGIPNSDFGEEVKAVVQPRHWDDAGPELAAELEAYCREHLARFKVPRTFDFDPALPRLDNGKLYKKALRDRYWTGNTRIG